MISDKAIIDKNCNFENSVEVGPFSVISKDVKIGKNTKTILIYDYTSVESCNKTLQSLRFTQVKSIVY